MRIKLQYISQGLTGKDQLYNIQRVLDAGCKWIQLRYKNAEKEMLLNLAMEVRKLTSQYDSIFIMNDHVDIAKKTDADGVHLGLKDAPVKDARRILGEEKIIGGTANTWEDILLRIGEKCDYIGLGPYRFTSTKEKLSPILGVEGIAAIMKKLAANREKIPIYAIGGITSQDVSRIMETGVFGVAVSGEITNCPDIEEVIQKFNEALYEKSYYSWERI